MCTIYENKVKWVISKEIIDKIKHSLQNDKDEISGVLLFSDTDCKDGICNKKSSKINIKRGDSDSVYTPQGIINFHTHPKICYINEKVKYGWCSGEDMAQTIFFARKNNLVHIVFSLEGAYIINVKQKIANKDIKILEKVLKMTHVFRSSDQVNQLKNFKKFLNPIIKSNKKTTLDMWLELINKLSLKSLYILHNDVGDKNLKIPNNEEKIFEVTLNKMKNNLTFDANFVEEKCHIKSFGEKS